MERMHGSGGSGKLKMRLANMVVFDDPVVDSSFANAHINQAICTPQTLERTESSNWYTLIIALKRLRPNNADAIDKLILLRQTERRLLGDSFRVARLSEQCDGLGLSLDIAQLDRPSVMKSIQLNRAETA